MNIALPATLAEPVAEAGDTPTDFTLEEIVPEDLPEPSEAEAEAVPVGAASPDPLQMLIEDLSGITGALRDPLPMPEHRAAADTDATPQESTPQPVAVALNTVLVEATPQSLAVDTNAVLTKAKPQPVAVDPEMALAEATPPITQPGTVAGAFVTTPPDLARVKAAPVDLAPADPTAIGFERLLAESAAIAPLAREESVAPADLRAARPVIVPVARQIAEAVVTARDDVVEIALAPEELGRIRMVMSGPEHSPHVVVWVERPEVLDQLRRNAAFLQECLGDAGMADASLEFHGDTSSGSRDDQRGNAAPGRPAFDAAEPIQSIPIAWTPMAIPARLDIRI